ncbi:unnamed protein product [Caenorhabditis auriculariae]|uniref:Uncharacterized protein n=1 Tax=Caenorhabditis auriculariae TaxID=2777116 RepID=A0A8S1GRE7_9PELO|nr:unnamed protein product [Caenorhabditis auriculariae]
MLIPLILCFLSTAFSQISQPDHYGPPGWYPEQLGLQLPEDAESAQPVVECKKLRSFTLIGEDGNGVFSSKQSIKPRFRFFSPKNGKDNYVLISCPEVESYLLGEAREHVTIDGIKNAVILAKGNNVSVMLKCDKMGRTHGRDIFTNARERLRRFTCFHK